MQPDRTRSHDPAKHECKRCSACGEAKPATDFYVSGGRLSSYCKDCQRQASRLAYLRRRQDPAARAQMRSVDRLRKRQERARLAQLDPDRERRAGRARRAAIRRLVAAHEPEYLSLLAQELVTQGGGRDG
jgi:recombinational DNA repair protein (RecF pathway)